MVRITKIGETVYLSFNGIKKTAHEWAKEKGISYKNVMQRIKRGALEFEEIFRPARKRGVKND